MAGKNKDRKKRQKKARESNALEKTVTPEKRKHGQQLIVFIVVMTLAAAGFVIYLQS